MTADCAVATIGRFWLFCKDTADVAEDFDGPYDDACAGSVDRGAAAMPAASRQARNREAVFLYRRRMSGTFRGLKILSSFFVMDTRFGEYMQYRIYCTTFFQICYHCLVVIEKMQVLPACCCRLRLPGSAFLPGKTVI